MSQKFMFTLNTMIMFYPSVELNLFITWDNEVYVFYVYSRWSLLLKHCSLLGLCCIVLSVGTPGNIWLIPNFTTR